MSLLDIRLQALVSNGTLKSYRLVELDENGKEGKSKFCNSERLILTFPNDQELTLETYCSGCAEDTGFIAT